MVVAGAQLQVCLQLEIQTRTRRRDRGHAAPVVEVEGDILKRNGVPAHTVKR